MENELFSRIIYLSAECLVVNKKIGEAVEGARNNIADLPQLLAAALPPAENAPDILPLPVAAHRLDVPVSGCVAFARTQSALGFLSAAFAKEYAPVDVSAMQSATLYGVEKKYWAIVETPQNNMPQGGPLPESGELIHWIQVDSKKNKSYAYTEPGPGRKKAMLRYRLAGTGRNYLFLEIQLLTGRHHQIRAQLEQIGLHVKGDLKYGARRSEKNGGIRLHARSLSFPDPADNSMRITICADPPLQDNLWLAFEDSITT
ncbi:MAG: RNA pseudouridine synthase [Treponema sp.]|jgi:23S rRNA pseudouridine1911/1915/1917 synthase|nr:RNA pseudouridine synthase [Treponema sp.]